MKWLGTLTIPAKSLLPYNVTYSPEWYPIIFTSLVPTPKMGVKHQEGGNLGSHIGNLSTTAPSSGFPQKCHTLFKNELLNSHEYFNFLLFSTTALTSLHYFIIVSIGPMPSTFSACHYLKNFSVTAFFLQFDKYNK